MKPASTDSEDSDDELDIELKRFLKFFLYIYLREQEIHIQYILIVLFVILFFLS